MKDTQNIKRTRPVHSNPTNQRRTARAPYNFVPLPGKLITVEPPLPLDRYVEHTGWFECELETCSPTYVRGVMSLADYNRLDQFGDLTPKDKEARAPFYATDPIQILEDRARPLIPGSSLRGMLRTLVEIIGYGKLRWLNETLKITFRAVAASREDPLSEPYRNLMGKLGDSKVLAGYWEKSKNGEWQIRPALKPKDKGWPEQNAYLKVKEASIPSGAITDFLRFNSHDYLPEYYPVSFNVAIRRGKRGQYVAVDKVGDERIGHPYKGTMVCSGNMLETAQPNQTSPRRNHALVLPPNLKAKLLPVNAEVLQDYRDSLTSFQKEDVWPGGDKEMKGGIENGSPVFYIVEKDNVVWFGHTPNFRVPALQDGHAAKPTDFVPGELRSHAEPDLAESIFGWVKEKGNVERQHAGRVAITDAEFLDAKNGVWYSRDPLIPATLGSPKVTTFQHYLVQDRSKGHDPDFRQTLAHYIHDQNETEIRGHKLYWHKGAKPKIEASKTEKEKESQLTRILPVREGVRFKFKIHFENLRDYELGALAWALQLPGEKGKIYRHKIGMGKPLGMGAIALTAAMYLTNRSGKGDGRYASLFKGGKLTSGAQSSDTETFIRAFEEFVLRKQDILSEVSHLADVERIQALLALLEWREGTEEWLGKTRYQSIEPENEYKERPVLPDPLAVANITKMNVLAGAPSEEIHLGVVKNFQPGRSFGFIKPDDMAGDIFFHISQLAEGTKGIQNGQRVKFKVRRGARGIEAYEVSLTQ